MDSDDNKPDFEEPTGWQRRLSGRWLELYERNALLRHLIHEPLFLAAILSVVVLIVAVGAAYWERAQGMGHLFWFVIGFAITDGMDMGVGTLLPFVGKTDVERRIAINTVGPHWDGNQVWFITAGGAIFAGGIVLEGGNPSSETRSYIAKNVDVSRIIALVTYGSSFQARTIATMLNKAMRRLHEETGVSVFFDTESEARVWIDEHRKQREGRYGDAEKP